MSAKSRTFAANSLRIINPCVRREQPMSACSPGSSRGLSAFANIGARRSQIGNVESGDETLPLVERPQCIDAALKIDLEMQIGGIGDMALQYRQGHIVAGSDREHRMTPVARLSEYARKIRPQGLDVRLHSHARTALRP